MKNARQEMVLASEPAMVDGSVLWAGLDPAQLRKQHAAGELTELEFAAVVFRAAVARSRRCRITSVSQLASSASGHSRTAMPAARPALRCWRLVCCRNPFDLS